MSFKLTRECVRRRLEKIKPAPTNDDIEIVSSKNTTPEKIATSGIRKEFVDVNEAPACFTR